MMEYFDGEAVTSALQKARQEPESMKARILAGARRIFGQFGYHGATTRLIAREVGVDISTLHYHWGDKGGLYQAVIYDIAQDLKDQLARVERIIRGKPLARRMHLAIDLMTDYLFEHPEISNLILLRYFSKTRAEMTWDQSIPMFVSDIARSMGLQEPDGSISIQSRMRVLAMMNAIHNFISGQDHFRAVLGLDQREYMTRTKETLRFLLIPAFTSAETPESPGTGTNQDKE